MSLGKIKISNHEGKKSIAGYISTYATHMDFFLEPVASRQSDKSPTHNIIARAPGGHNFTAGIAWESPVKDRHGEVMFSLKFNVPELWKEELDLVAFDTKGGYHEIRVAREKNQAAA